MPKTEILESNIVIMEGKGEMRMIYYTGDIHGNPALLVEMCRFYEMKATDTLVILGDVGVNYSLDVRDTLAKRILSSVTPTVLCIHGNHEIRPNNIKSYKQKNGMVEVYGLRIVSPICFSQKMVKYLILKARSIL